MKKPGNVLVLVLATALIVAVFRDQSRAQDAAKPDSTAWEYKVIAPLPTDPQESIPLLNAAGREGWEVSGTYVYVRSNDCVVSAVLKRPIPRK